MPVFGQTERKVKGSSLRVLSKRTLVQVSSGNAMSKLGRKPGDAATISKEDRLRWFASYEAMKREKPEEHWSYEKVGGIVGQKKSSISNIFKGARQTTSADTKRKLDELFGAGPELPTEPDKLRIMEILFDLDEIHTARLLERALVLLDEQRTKRTPHKDR